MPKLKKNKHYEVVSSERKYRYGAFPFSKSGLSDAKKYAKELQRARKEKFSIVSK